MILSVWVIYSLLPQDPLARARDLAQLTHCMFGIQGALFAP